MEPKLNLSAYLLSILTEESSEIIKEIFINKTKNIFFNKDFIKETIDLIAIIDMLETNNIIEYNTQKYNIENIFDFKIELTNLIYIISKSLRFSLNDINPETKIKNNDQLNLTCSKIYNFIIENININEEEISLMKKEKINKVEKFIKYSKEKGTLI